MHHNVSINWIKVAERCIYYNYFNDVRQSFMEKVAFEHALDDMWKIWTRDAISG